MNTRADTEPLQEQRNLEEHPMLASFPGHGRPAEKRMRMEMVLIYQAPPPYPLLEGLAGTIHPYFRQIVHKVGGYLEYRRFPRSQQDMCIRFEQYFPNEADVQKTELVTSKDGLSKVQWNHFTRVVLLWPDANGIGWTPIERKVFNNRSRDCRVDVLNGRGRLFELKWHLWRSFQVKRFLEKSFIPEILMVVGFLITSPVMALWDRIMKEGR
jgi:hypothetical protein